MIAGVRARVAGALLVRSGLALPGRSSGPLPESCDAWRRPAAPAGRWLPGWLLIAGWCLSLVAPGGAADFEAGKSAFQKGDFATAMKEFSPLAGKGDTRAQLALGIIYAKGSGTVRDATAAYCLFRLVEENGSPKERKAASQNLKVLLAGMAKQDVATAHARFQKLRAQLAAKSTPGGGGSTRIPPAAGTNPGPGSHGGSASGRGTSAPIRGVPLPAGMSTGPEPKLEALPVVMASLSVTFLGGTRASSWGTAGDNDRLKPTSPDDEFYVPKFTLVTTETDLDLNLVAVSDGGGSVFRGDWQILGPGQLETHASNYRITLYRSGIDGKPAELETPISIPKGTVIRQFILEQLVFNVEQKETRTCQVRSARVDRLRAELASDPMNADKWCDLGSAYLTYHQDRVADELFAHALRTVARTDSALFSLGYRLMNAARWREARPVFQELTNRSPGDSEARLQLGKALLGLREYDLAARELTVLEKLDASMAADLAQQLQAARTGKQP